MTSCKETPATTPWTAGRGPSTAVCQPLQDYAWWANADGTWTVRDLRDGSPADGRDTLISIERIQFSDQTIKTSGLSNQDMVTYAFENLLNYAPTAPADAANVVALGLR